MKNLAILFLLLIGSSVTLVAQFAVTFTPSTNTAINAYELYAFDSNDMKDTNNIGHWVAWCPSTNHVIAVANWVKEGKWLTVRGALQPKHGPFCPPVLFQPSLFDVPTTNAPVADPNFEPSFDAPTGIGVIKL